MDAPSQHALPRAPRLQLGDGIPAVVRHPNGICKQAALKTVSVTGGLLSVPQRLDQGSYCRLMFVTHTGPVLGTAQMLNPVSPGLQPFRFTGLHQSDHRKLGAAISSVLEPDREKELQEQEWMEKYRAAIAHRDAPKTHRWRTLLFAVTFVTVGLLSAFYLFHTHLR